MNRFFNPIAIVREYVKPKRVEKQKLKSRVLSQEDLVNTTFNRRQPGGRIYFKLDEEGKSLSHSVSPYSDVYLDNIEEELHEWAKAIRKAGYLTISSCAGHSTYEETFITFAVNKREQMEKVKNHLGKMFLVNIYEKDLLYYNNNVLVKENGRYDLVRKKEKSKRQDVINYLNTLFLRGYNDYVVFDVQVCYSIEEGHNHYKGFDKLKYFYKKACNYFFRKRTIKRVAKKFKTLPKYDL